jgi:hypothetical protein
MRTALHFEQVSIETDGHKFKLELAVVLCAIVIYLPLVNNNIAARTKIQNYLKKLGNNKQIKVIQVL